MAAAYNFPERERKVCARPKCADEDDIVEFARQRLHFEPDEKQIEVLRSISKRGILNCSRQWGKTSVSAAKAVHRVYTRPESLVLVASPSERQSRIWMRRAAGMLRHAGVPIRGDGENEVSLLLPNESRIVGLPCMPDKVRGFSALSMLLIDEAAYVQDEMYTALRPMLSDGKGDLWMMSTPCGKNGFFYETWEHGGERWHRVKVLATECERISAEFLEEQRGVMGAALFAQEHMCEFIGSGLYAFDRDVLESAFDEGFESWGDITQRAMQQNLPVWLRSKLDEMFIIGLDLGRKQDHAAWAILECSNGQLVVRDVTRIPLGTPYWKVVEMVRDLVRSSLLRNRCSLVVDGSGVGDGVVDMFRRADLGCAMMAVSITGGVVSRPGRSAGWRNVPKFELMSGLHLALENGQMKIAKRMKEAGSLMKELLAIRVNANGSMGAAGGEHDDLAMAVALACWRAKKGWNDRGSGGFL